MNIFGWVLIITVVSWLVLAFLAWSICAMGGWADDRMEEIARKEGWLDEHQERDE